MTLDELERRVDEVLFYNWDPIGINHYPAVRDEYQSYVPSILYGLRSGDQDLLISLLQEIQVGYMGLKADPELAQNVAMLLYEHKGAIENGYE
tara:strand:+ start:5080 stop:5358 length:279 start_codon:yes stop_codon:yes gene_type:complete